MKNPPSPWGGANPLWDHGLQMIVTIYSVQAYQVPIVNPRWPPKIQDGRHEIECF